MSTAGPGLLTEVSVKRRATVSAVQISIFQNQILRFDQKCLQLLFTASVMC